MAQLSGQLFRPRAVDRVTAAVSTVLARWLLLRAPGPIVVAGQRVDIAARGAVRPDVLEPDAPVAAIHAGTDVVLAIGSGALVRGLAQLVLGGPEELTAARSPTAAEEAVWALGVATAIDAFAPRAVVTVLPAARTFDVGDHAFLAIDVAVDGGVHGRAWLAVPPSRALLGSPPAVDHLEWLEAVAIETQVVIAHAALALHEIERLEARDVIVVGRIDAPDVAALRIARGGFPVTLSDASDRVTVRGPYQRGHMDETLAEDLTFELAVAAGAVTISAKQFLTLAPGEVLRLNRPAAGQVDLVVGREVIGRGELLDVDGELAVRILAIHPR